MTGKPSKRRYAKAAGRAKPRAPKRPRMSADLLSTVFASMGEGISVFDRTLRLVAWNERFAGMIGADPKVVKIGAPLRDILLSQAKAGEFGPGDAESEVARRIATLWREKFLVAERARPNGRVVQLRRSALPDGGFVTIYVDVTEIKRTEAALRDAKADLERRVEDRTAALRRGEERYALVERAVNDGIWDWNVSTGENYLSPQWKRLLGYEDAELANVVSTFDGLMHPDDRASARGRLVAHFKTGAPYAMEMRLRHKDGSYRWFLSRGEALRDAQGRAVRMVGSIADIDERKRAEAALAETEARVSSMIDSAMDAIVTVDDSMRIVAFNRSAERMFRCAASEAVGRSLERFIPGRFRAAHADQMRAFAESKLTMRAMGQGAEVRALRADGEEFPADVSIASHRGHGKQFYSAIVRDITQRKQSEELVKQGLIDLGAAKEAAEVANRAKSAFLASMSHELRTPLNAIIGFSEMIVGGTTGQVTSKQAEYADDILSSGRHLLSVINDILDMSKIEAGHYELNVAPLRLARVVESALAIAGGLAREKDVRIEKNLTPDAPPIEGDERALKQVLLNLLSNAVKFNARGGRIAVGLRVLPSGEQEIRVADNGVGIEPEALKKLFRPFQQAGDQYTRRSEGTGLGLWISLQFMKMHGGTLRLESTPGVGTTAVATLPPKAVRSGRS